MKEMRGSGKKHRTIVTLICGEAAVQQPQHPALESREFVWLSISSPVLRRSCLRIPVALHLQLSTVVA